MGESYKNGFEGNNSVRNIINDSAVSGLKTGPMTQSAKTQPVVNLA